MTVSPGDTETALGISPAFYEAALHPDRWPAVLERMRHVFDADVAQIVFTKLTTAKILMSFQSGAPPEVMKRWLALNHAEDDPRTMPGLQILNKPAHCRQLVTTEEFHNSLIYKEIFVPFGFEYTMFVTVPLETQDWGFVVGFIRSPNKPIWSEAELGVFQLYVPHLRQAAALAGRLYYDNQLLSAFATAFDGVRLATLIVDRHGGLQYANEPARRLLEAGTAIWRSNGHVAPVDPTAAARFREFVSDSATGLETGTNHMVIPRSDGGASLYATVSKIDDSVSPSRFPLSELVYAVVFLNDPSETYETHSEMLQRLFGLTRTEAGIMAAYADGSSAPTIAQMVGRSLETVRSHLKSIRNKTGVRTQAEIVRLVAGLSPKRS